ncbi:MAG: GNAT family N-acetyltransferase, partial [Bacteroidota bacterium]
MGPYNVRPASGRDLDAMNDIYNESVLNSTATFDLEPRDADAARAWFLAHGPAYPLLVAEQGETVVGWASLSPFAPRPAYRLTVEDSVYVHRDHRGRGVGRALLRELLTAASALGYHAVIAKIADHNESSLALHRRFGFVAAGTLKEVGWKFGKWLDVDILQRSLAEPGPIAPERHFTAAVFVVHDGRVLLLRHRALGRWLPPGGHLRPGELPDEAAVREVREETGIVVRLAAGPQALAPSGPRLLARPAGIQLEEIEPGHEHIDLVYFAVPASGPLEPRGNAESLAVGW